MTVRRVPLEEFRGTLTGPGLGDTSHHWLYPSVHRLINGGQDRSFLDWRVAPYEDPFNREAMAYWEAAVYFLDCFLGWSHPGLGLARYYERSPLEAGTHPLLSLFGEVWNSRHELDLLAMWVWTSYHRMGSGLESLMNPGERLPIPADLPVQPTASWMEGFRRRFTETTVPGLHPYQGGSNPLHLGYNLALERSQSPGELILGDPERREARFLHPTMEGWYAGLHDQCAEAGALGWRVDVVVPGFGWVGRFRRSPATGLWYRGSHEEHLLGNVVPDPERFSEHGSESLRSATEAALTYMQANGIRPARGQGPAFAFRAGEVRANAKGEPRTILGAGWDQDGDAVYIVRRRDTLDTKHAQRAHQTWGPLLDLDPTIVSALVPLPGET